MTAMVVQCTQMTVFTMTKLFKTKHNRLFTNFHIPVPLVWKAAIQMGCQNIIWMMTKQYTFA